MFESGAFHASACVSCVLGTLEEYEYRPYHHSCAQDCFGFIMLIF